MKFLGLAIVSAVLVVVLSSTDSVEAVKWPGQYVDDAKNYLLGLFRDRVISRSVIVANFEESMNKIKERYAQAKANGELDGMNDDEAQAFYYKIVIEETRRLRANVENQQAGGNGAPVTEAPISSLPVEQQKIIVNLENDKVADESEEGELMNELDKIASDEAEMGWSMSPEAKLAMKARTKQVLTDMMSNEMRQLAMAILTSYFTGGPIAGTITTAVSASIKFKLVEYLMNTVLDVLGSVMGREIRISPAIEATPVVAPVAARAEGFSARQPLRAPELMEMSY